MGIYLEPGSGIGVTQLSLRHLWRSATFEKQCGMQVSEGVEAGARKAELVRGKEFEEVSEFVFCGKSLSWPKTRRSLRP
jgi:hypothetical protein